MATKNSDFLMTVKRTTVICKMIHIKFKGRLFVYVLNL
jgi:hypothetical protein